MYLCLGRLITTVLIPALKRCPRVLSWPSGEQPDPIRVCISQNRGILFDISLEISGNAPGLKPRNGPGKDPICLTFCVTVLQVSHFCTSLTIGTCNKHTVLTYSYCLFGMKTILFSNMLPGWYV